MAIASRSERNLEDAHGRLKDGFTIAADLVSEEAARRVVDAVEGRSDRR